MKKKPNIKRKAVKKVEVVAPKHTAEECRKENQNGIDYLEKLLVHFTVAHSNVPTSERQQVTIKISEAIFWARVDMNRNFPATALPEQGK